MRKISADYIFPVSSDPVKNGVVIVDDDGTIIEIVDPQENSVSENNNCEVYEGIICPGFINTHCHLELSHLCSAIPEKLGMTGFIKEIISRRFQFSEQEIHDAIAVAESEMVKNGIVAVGDISNNNSTFEQKAKGNLYYHTFIEIFDLSPDKAQEAFNKGYSLKKELLEISGLPASIVPHAPYTVSEKLLKLINEYTATDNGMLSIHNQESETENELFISGSGLMYDTFKSMGINMNLIRHTGLNSLQSTVPLMNNALKLLLVHNTFTSPENVKWAEKEMAGKLYWCTCPNANLYIENKLPDYAGFIEEKVCMTIGTDSLASNWSLSVLDELKTISNHYPQIPLQKLIKWATKNGADFLGISKMGTIEKGKKPGLNLLQNINELTITPTTKVVKLL